MPLDHWLYTLPLRVRSLFRRREVERDLDDEMQYHMERLMQENIARGMSPKEARYAAIRAMDGLTQNKERARETWKISGITNFFGDVRYAFRLLRKSPGFTTAAVATLALGIGANAVVFAVLNALFVHPLNLPDEQSLYSIQRGDNPSESYPDYLDLRDRNRSFDGLAAYDIRVAGMDTGDTTSRVWAYDVSGNYFDVLRLQPFLGQFFHGTDEHGPDSAPYVVLNYAFWHSFFHDDRGVVGRTVQLNKHPFTILGVAPPEFHGTIVFITPDLFVPMVDEGQLDSSNRLDERGSHWVHLAMGHLKPGVTPAQAIADLNSIGADLEKAYPKDDGHMTFALSRPGLYGDSLGRAVRLFLTGLMMLAGLILLAACANLGSLFAARAADRSREVALRLALGSRRGRILRQLFTEAVLISLVGGAVGMWGSVLLLRALSIWQPFPQFPIYLAVRPDANVYAVAVVLAVVSGLLFGAVPVRQILRTDAYQIVKAGSTGAVGRRITIRDLLLAAQIAICAVLVTSSMVALRGLARSLHSDFGFEAQNALLFDTNLKMAGYSDDSIPAMQRRMIDSLQAIPGVESVGLIDRLPLSGDINAALVFSDKTIDVRPANAAARSLIYVISPEYLRTARTTLLAGRNFTWHDDKDTPRVAVVNQEFARKIFGAATSAIDGYFKLPDGTRIQVVGVVEQGKYENLSEDPKPAMFLPVPQSPTSQTYLAVRSNRVDSNEATQALAAAIKSKLRDLDAGLPFYIQTWNQIMDTALFPARVATMSLGVLGMMGAMLSITGIFGMAAYSVSKRLRELGIRIALGAQGRGILQAALGRAFKLLAFGSLAGLLLGILASRVLAHIVYEATPRDPVVLFGAVLVMVLLGLLATWIPAQRALRVDPLILLREE